MFKLLQKILKLWKYLQRKILQILKYIIRIDEKEMNFCEEKNIFLNWIVKSPAFVWPLISFIRSTSDKRRFITHFLWMFCMKFSWNENALIVWKKESKKQSETNSFGLESAKCIDSTDLLVPFVITFCSFTLFHHISFHLCDFFFQFQQRLQ